MSLLTVCQNVVDEVGLGARPAVIATSDDQLPRQLMALANRTIRSLIRDFNWQELIEVQQINTNGSGIYNLPSGWQRYVSRTFYDATNYRPVNGAITLPTWQQLVRGNVTLTTFGNFRIQGGEIYLTPDPGDTDIFNFFQTKNAVLTGIGGQAEVYTADDDVCKIPEELITLGTKWRIKQAKGLEYAEDINEFVSQANLACAQNQPAPSIDFTGRWPPGPDYYATLPPTVPIP